VSRQLVCIACPIGCRLIVEVAPAGSASVTGNLCPKGEEYAREEIAAPRRILTTTVKADAPGRLRVPVRTDTPLPTGQITALLTRLHAMRLPLPIRRGQVLLQDVAGTGVNVIASMTVTGTDNPGASRP
jgi:CxxC motif-containing protein